MIIMAIEHQCIGLFQMELTVDVYLYNYRVI